MGNSYTIYDHIEMFPGGREEILPEVTEDFPYAGVRSEHDRYTGRMVPWHWHEEIELFYALSGTTEYGVPHERVVVEEGSCGFVNSNVLHETISLGKGPGSVLLIHMFKPSLLAAPGSRLWRTCVEPLVRATSVGMLAVSPVDEASRALCEAVRASFDVFERAEPGWEMRVRDALGEPWLDFLDLARPRLVDGPQQFARASEERLKLMIDYVGLHYPEQITVADIAAAGFTSERECHRTFREELGCTPSAYLREHRVRQACRMLTNTTRPIAAIGEMCGLGSASHFGQVFRQQVGKTPSEYRKSSQGMAETR